MANYDHYARRVDSFQTDGSSGLIADPGNGGAISVTVSGVCPLTIAGSETRTLATPAFINQEIALICDVQSVGNGVVTVASAINAAGNNTITFSAAKGMVLLKAMQVAGVKVWRVIATDTGEALSTV